MSACCVTSCKNRHSATTKLKFYRIPAGQRPFQANRRRLWQRAIQEANGSSEELRGNVRVCGAHFISGEACMDHDSPDFVPSVFACTKGSPRKKVKRLYGRRRLRRRKVNMGKDEILSPSEEDSSEEDRSPVMMETESDISQELQTPATLSVPKEVETLTQEASAENGATVIKSPATPSPRKTSQSVEGPRCIPKLEEMNPVVLLKRLIGSAGGYRCELCDQHFAIVSELVKHKRCHEQESLVMCDNCGVPLTDLADFTQHTCAKAAEPSFPCNICDRSFTSSHCLKRHKLLHVKDGRKCGTCGVLFCRRHNHNFFHSVAEPVQDPSNEEEEKEELQNVVSDLMPEVCPPEKSEPTLTDGVGEDTHSTMTVTLPLTPLLPGPQKPGPLAKTRVVSFTASYKNNSPKIPAPLLPRPPPPVHVHSINPGTSSQYIPAPLQCPAAFLKHPESASSLKIFSPQFLTSALLNVKRNYEYILRKSNVVKKVVVKEEQCERPLVSPAEERAEKVKKDRIAYDLEIVV